MLANNLKKLRETAFYTQMHTVGQDFKKTAACAVEEAARLIGG